MLASDGARDGIDGGTGIASTDGGRGIGLGREGSRIIGTGEA